MAYDPLIPIDRPGLAALMRFRDLSPTELARRAGVTDQAVFNLLKAPAHRSSPTERVRLSRARAIAAALDVEVDEDTGAFTVPIQVLDVDGVVTRQVPAALAILDRDAKRAEHLLEPSRPGFGLGYVMNLELWTRNDALPLALRVEWSALWVRLAEMASTHADPSVRRIFADALSRLGDELAKPGGAFSELQPPAP